ncbi:hypothetical protein BJX65DRAFT_200858 [Aspergillus insuetus]
MNLAAAMDLTQLIEYPLCYSIIQGFHVCPGIPINGRPLVHFTVEFASRARCSRRRRRRSRARCFLALSSSICSCVLPVTKRRSQSIF